MESKKCFKCGEVKILSMFYKHPQMEDGRVNKCKECNKLDVRKNRAAKIDYYREYDRQRFQDDPRVSARHRKYQKTEKGKESCNKSKAAYNRRNPIKRGASHMVCNAVRDGKLAKPEDCECCGSKPKRLHGHHDDYAKPLNVRWLCPGCHTKWHKENGPGLNAE